MKKAILVPAVLMAAVLPVFAEGPVPVSPVAVDCNSAIKNALQNSPDIKTAKYYVNQAKIQVMITSGVMFDPVLRVKGEFNRNYHGVPDRQDYQYYGTSIEAPLPIGASLGLSGTFNRSDYTLSGENYNDTGVRLYYTQQLLKGLIGQPSLNSVAAAQYRFMAAKELLRGTVLEKAADIKKRMVYLWLCANRAESDRQFVLYASKIEQAGGTALASAEEASRKAELELSQARLAEAREAFFASAGFAPAEWRGLEAVYGGITESAQAPVAISAELEETLAALQSPAAYDRIIVDIEKISAQTESTEAFPELSLTLSMGLSSMECGSGAGEAFSSMFEANAKDYRVGLYFGTRIPNNYGRGMSEYSQESLKAAKERYNSQLINQRLRVRSAARNLDIAIKRKVLTSQAREGFEKRLSQAASSGATEIAIAQRDLHEAGAKELNAQYEQAVAAFEWDMINGKYERIYSGFLKDSAF
ncbi:MAG: hypothetical protein LLG37_06175 [Spirochaetia bacterium]|nr:hypothetical protein [Spirochaetia bacterium]